MHLREQKYFFIIPLLGIVTIFITISYLGLHAIEISLSVLLIVSVIYGLKHILESRNVIKSAKKMIPRISEVRVFGKTRYRIKI